ncbi:siderophore-interacting protein [Streptomyces sp. H27-D2]|uniref:siderophore-interacting protein n=1 Tax=Streptomyces sp. H27-D2 TaxID=3046304 RepID=UPI002DB69409|nr:SIP domain-containing protein [Streptomyces sp. H27-D2]MEC4020843.1 SIP domain-containing protein [Streptomyces sp. H27-D2]
MPSLPPRLAARFEQRTGKYTSVVQQTSRLSEGLALARFRCDQFIGKAVGAGEHIGVRVSERDFRHYTLFQVDALTGEYSVVIDLAPDGPGARWALGHAPDQEIDMPAPAGALRAGPADRHLIAGDATALATVRALLDGIAGASGHATAAVEVPTPDVPAVAALLSEAQVLAAHGTPGRALDAWLSALLTEGFQPQQAYLAGHAASVQRLRQTVRARAGLPRRAVHTQVYWADGRTGL